jgi:hypothetical protein
VASDADSLGMSPISSASGAVNLPNAQNSALDAITVGAQKLDSDAQQIANPRGNDDAAPLIDLNQALVLAQADAKVISTENKILGSSFDAFG